MQVRLVSYTPNTELVMAAAARVCYSDRSGGEIMEKMSDEEAARLLRSVIASGHYSVLEHASFSFAIDGLSRAASHQLVRHRLASYSQQSQRYVSLKKREYVIPPRIAGEDSLRERYELAMQAAYDAYNSLREAGVPAEDARYVLPNATCTRLMMTMNARELLHVASLRLCNRAQWEILDLFKAIKEQVNRVAPLVGERMQPKCERLGYCDEADSCGRMPAKPAIGAS